MSKSASMLIASVGLAGLCAACASATHAAAGSIAANDWHLVELGNTAAIPADAARRPTIRFSPDSARASGSGGCNSYGGTAVINGASLRVSRVISTKRACVDQALNQQETRFFSALETVDRFAISADTLRLFRGSAVSLRFVR